MFRRHRKTQGYGAPSLSSKFSDDDDKSSFTSNLRDLGLIGSLAAKSSGHRSESIIGSRSFTDAAPVPERGTPESSNETGFRGLRSPASRSQVGIAVKCAADVVS